MREMIVASDSKGRAVALAKLLPMQRSDFEAIFRAMEGFPVTIRLLDPPLHEFPKEPDEIEALAGELGIAVEALRSIIDRMHEVNPMLGLLMPSGNHLQVTAMQVRAIFEAACTVALRKGGSCRR